MRLERWRSFALQHLAERDVPHHESQAEGEGRDTREDGSNAREQEKGDSSYPETQVTL